MDLYTPSRHKIGHDSRHATSWPISIGCARPSSTSLIRKSSLMRIAPSALFLDLFLMRIISSAVLLLHVFLSPTHAQTFTNRTIDDTNGDSFFVGRPVLPRMRLPARLHQCVRRDVPDLGSLSIAMDFTGVAIYVYFILPNDEGRGITTTTAANFSIDGTVQGNFTHDSDGTTDVEFNALVFTQTGLSNETHSLLIPASGPDSLYINFDYATYTFQEATVDTSSSTPSSSSSVPGASGTSSSHSSNHTRAIVGGAVGGGVGLVALLCVALFFLCKRPVQSADRPQEATVVDHSAPPGYYLKA
ncbi:hypothetical protein FB45DRAFT_1018483 [Roridomyces roridus]|uniref:Mid2 domain-containing protein n=1 Tax=Roridomyces roridus TaxID=1738132 RepID=A0AAD7FZ95_9AGAR|nr:hypothetical protein FB45DRAFT_1018483 [Roridomyces roridus]